MAETAQLLFDEVGNVLYVKLIGSCVKTSQESPNDDFVIINYDHHKTIVGIQLVAAKDISWEFWKIHPDRHLIPQDVLNLADCWMLQHRVQELENAIKKHRDKSGHDLCWENDRELWSTLIDTHKDLRYPHESLPDRQEFLTACQHYYDSRLVSITKK